MAPKYPTLETLIAAKTDFFFAGWNYGMKIGGEVTPKKTLKPYGIDTLVLSESCIHSSKQKTSASMALLFDDITKLGIIFDKQDKAVSLINEWKIQIAKVKKRALVAPAKISLLIRVKRNCLLQEGMRCRML